MSDSFPLTVTIPAEEWAATVRRLRYVEAALVQAYRNQRQLREWFTAGELVAMRLPGLPVTRHGIFRRAAAEGWISQPASGVDGERQEFHFSSLPRRTFDEMIRRIIQPVAGISDTVAPAPAPIVPAPPPLSLPPAGDASTAPGWMLPLLRLIRNEPQTDVDDAMELLAETWFDDATMPSREQVAAILARYRRPPR